MSFRVEITETAYRDLDQILSWLLSRQPRSAQILQPIRSSNSRSRLPRDQRSTTESTEIHGKENPNQLPLSVSFPGTTPARRVGSFRGYPFVMIFLAVVISGARPTWPLDCRPSSTKPSPAWNRFHFPPGWLTRIRSLARNDCDPWASAGRLPRQSITPIRGPGCEENFAMIPSTNRRSFLYGASVAGFGVFAMDGTGGQGGWGRTRC